MGVFRHNFSFSVKKIQVWMLPVQSAHFTMAIVIFLQQTWHKLPRCDSSDGKAEKSGLKGPGFNPQLRQES